MEIYPVGVLTYGEVMENGELTSIKLKARRTKGNCIAFYNVTRSVAG